MAIKLVEKKWTFKEIICKRSPCRRTDVEDICKIALALSGRFQKKQQEGIHAELCHLKKPNKSTEFDFIKCFSSPDRELN